VPIERAWYRVTFTRAASRALERLPVGVAERLVAAVEALAANPRGHGTVKLAGMDAMYRVRVGTYRAVYQVDDGARVVTVAKIGHRRDVYR
jgi:mRNA interferase RelE/StbE